MNSPFLRRLALLAIILATAWFFGPKPERPSNPVAAPDNLRPPPSLTATSRPSPPSLPESSPAGLAAARTPSAPVVPGPAAVSSAAPAATLPAAANRVPTPDPAAAIAVDQVRRMLRDYRTLTGENPVGTNAEIMRTLMGDNPRQARLGPPEGQSLNDQGELVDPWGTPIFFHQLSKTLMEIRSAGPDRTLWTDDDIVAR